MRAPRRLDLLREFLLLLRVSLLRRLCELRVDLACLLDLFCERFCVFLDDDFLCDTWLFADCLGVVRAVEAFVALISRPTRRSERKLFRRDTTPWLPVLGLTFRRLLDVLLLAPTALSALRDMTARRGRPSSLRSLFLIRSLLRRLGLTSFRLSLLRLSLTRSFASRLSLRRSSKSLRRSSIRRFLFISRLRVLARDVIPRLLMKLRPSKLPPVYPKELKPP